MSMRLRPCIRRSIPLIQLRYPSSRQIHTTLLHRREAESEFDEEQDRIAQEIESLGRSRRGRRYTEAQASYAHYVSGRSMSRWMESQEPKGKVQFMTMGREFTFPYELSQMSYMNLNHMRELRAYYRKIMYEMPQLRKFQRQFRPPTKDEVLRFRYTSYLGENHPAAKKVVLTASVKKLRRALEGKRPHPVDDGWEHKFKLLCGTRYNPETDMIRMSCEQFPYPAQNKRWLSDKIDQMINLASMGESFLDIPLDSRHVKRKRIYKFPQEWLKLTPERQRAEQAVKTQIYLPALHKCAELAKVESLADLPYPMKKRLRGIVNATVRNAVRPGVYADLNDAKVRELIVNESLKQLVRDLEGVEESKREFITPDLSEEAFEKAFQAERERIAARGREESLRIEEDKRERVYTQQQAYASAAAHEEATEVTPDELARAEQELGEAEADDPDAALKQALKVREERRKLILSRLEEPEVPEWLKHAVDTEDQELFPMASGRFSAPKSRTELLAEFFEQELNDLKVGSEEETKLLDFIRGFIVQEENGDIEKESVESIKKRVHAMLKEIEDRNESH